MLEIGQVGADGSLPLVDLAREFPSLGLGGLAGAVLELAHVLIEL